MPKSLQHLSSVGRAATEFRTLTEELLPKALEELLASVTETSGDLNRPEVDYDEEVVVSAIGFTGDTARGCLAMSLPANLGHKFVPGHEAPTRDGIADWVGELSNQLLGRLKNKLLHYGIVVQLCPPAVVGGTRVQLWGTRTGVIAVSAELGGYPIEAWFDARVDPDLVLQEADELPQAEGEAILF